MKSIKKKRQISSKEFPQEKLYTETGTGAVTVVGYISIREASEQRNVVVRFLFYFIYY